MPRFSRFLATATAAAALACGGSGAGDSTGGILPPAQTVASVVVTPGTLTLSPSTSGRLTAEARDGAGVVIPGAAITWTTGAASIATVASDGTVTAVGAGVTPITALAGNRSASAMVTVDWSYDLDRLGVPKVVTHDYIELAKIARISRFRSGIGHDYSDTIERCRTMKHYFMPVSGSDWSTVTISAPMDGRIAQVLDETTFGKQVQIVSTANPAVTAVIFHVRPDAGVVVGATVTGGQRLGSHIGTQTMSDFALRVETKAGGRLVSYFDALADSVYQRYAARGVASRQAMIIGAAERDADPLACVGETYQGTGSVANWVDLNSALGTENSAQR